MSVHKTNWAASSEESAFKHAQKCEDSDHHAHVQSIILAFTLHSYIIFNDSVSGCAG